MNETPIEATVYMVVGRMPTSGELLLLSIHTREDKELHASEARHVGRILNGDLQIIIYSPEELTTAEAEQVGEQAIRQATGQLGTELIPRYSE